MPKVAQKGIFSSQPASHCEHALNCHLDETASTAGQRGRERENGRRNAGGRARFQSGGRECACGLHAKTAAGIESVCTWNRSEREGIRGTNSFRCYWLMKCTDEIEQICTQCPRLQQSRQRQFDAPTTGTTCTFAVEREDLLSRFAVLIGRV